MPDESTMPPGMKRCTKCGEVKSVDGFSRHNRARDGYYPACHDCRYPVPDRTEKACTKCGIVKPLASFSTRPLGLEKRQSACRECCKADKKRRWAAGVYQAWIAVYRAQPAVLAKEAEVARRRRSDPVKSEVIRDQRRRSWRKVYYAGAAYREANRLARARRRVIEAGARVLGKVNYAEIQQRDRGLCWLCGLPVPDDQLHYDHAIAVSKGGEDSTRNVRVSHALCNRRKGAKDIQHQPFLI